MGLSKWWSRQSTGAKAAWGAAAIGGVGAVVAAVIQGPVPALISSNASGDDSGAQHIPETPAVSSISPTPAPPEQESPEVGGTSINTCSIGESNIDTGGGDISIQCEGSLPRSQAGVSLELGGVLNAVFLRPAEELPPPDEYPGYESGPYCHWWGEWPTAVPDLYLFNPEINIGLESGTGELVAITNVEFEIFQRTPITPDYGSGDSATLINCMVGGGGNPGYYIVVDTVAVETTLLLGEQEPGSYTLQGTMPPAAIDSADVEYTSGTIRIESASGYLYEGSLTVTARVNGEEERIDIGSRENPLRWISDHTEEYIALDYAHEYSWDPEAGMWVEGTDIYG